MLRTRNFVIILLLFITSSCAYIQRNSFEPQLPKGLEGAKKVDVKKFFDGDINAFSVKFDADDNIISSRVIKINGSWEDEKGIIRQQFVNNNGKKDSRTWLITIEDKDGNFTAIGHDILAPAQGLQIDNIIQMVYTLSKNDAGVKSGIDHKDLMYLVDDNSMIMISKLSQKGKYIGKEVVSLIKDSEDGATSKSLASKEKKIFAPAIKTINPQEEKESSE